MPEIPVIRWGQPYTSLEVENVGQDGDGNAAVFVSQANPGLISRDLLRVGEAWTALQGCTTAELLALLSRAGDLFLHADLPLGERSQSPEDYIRQLSSTSGLPQELCRQNMLKIHHVCTHMPEILHGLTRGLDLDVLDRGYIQQDGQWLSFQPLTRALGVLLPSNSPGVNTLWLPAVPLKTPLVLKPGREDPWTPFRIVQALIAAGFPARSVCYYPCGHEGGTRILEACDRSLLFGGGPTVEPWMGNPRVQIHGPGRSKIIFGPDTINNWPEYLDVMVESIANNGGRSCINASTIVVPSHAAEIAEALAQRLAGIKPAAADPTGVQLAGFANPAMAEGINHMIENGLSWQVIEDISAGYREGGRLVEEDGVRYLLPTILLSHSKSHSLSNTEYPFAFTAVVEMPVEEMVEFAEPSLVVTALTQDAALIQGLLRSPQIDRVNLGPVPTNRVDWDQPHEGNLFDFLYRRRAIQIS